MPLRFHGLPLGEVSPRQRHTQGRANFLGAPRSDPPEVNPIPARTPIPLAQVESNRRRRVTYVSRQSRITPANRRDQRTQRTNGRQSEFESFEAFHSTSDRQREEYRGRRPVAAALSLRATGAQGVSRATKSPSEARALLTRPSTGYNSPGDAAAPRRSEYPRVDSALCLCLRPLSPSLTLTLSPNRSRPRTNPTPAPKTPQNRPKPRHPPPASPQRLNNPPGRPSIPAATTMPCLTQGRELCRGGPQ